MAVCLNKSWHDAPGTQIDDPGVGANQAGNLGPVTDGNDPAVGDRDRLGRWPRIVDGEHGSGHDEVCIGHGLQA
ncbi:Uncharacterised protein [Mycobacterium tuberculosis]|uniref:Uncharacterized protein n=1 Tax=Mycobacterium tuberculosis TaxID=1773 RepID=A0A0U0UM46_MYCTX|nr:Uncharacterised protein [Mycobacterium tuberculosis]CFE47595.1 Uncharacterised protein [Mycobacterium tuberculosis]CFR44957.1 Uncharacterised protein [Mycobacterium tuberculosis]CFR76245.1 Uncharacterised protein [Mycobacterium tuberculosis]CFS31332.1 Uncharacterised protein [Mycobacterium tuberculosis]